MRFAIGRRANGAEAARSFNTSARRKPPAPNEAATRAAAGKKSIGAIMRLDNESWRFLCDGYLRATSAFAAAAAIFDRPRETPPPPTRCLAEAARRCSETKRDATPQDLKRS